MRWRRRVEKALGSAGLTFTQWQVLESAHALIIETEDAVSQNQIAIASASGIFELRIVWRECTGGREA